MSSVYDEDVLSWSHRKNYTAPTKESKPPPLYRKEEGCGVKFNTSETLKWSGQKPTLGKT